MDDHHRLVVKDTLRTIDKNHARKLLVAEFDFLPLYFPVYYAHELGLFAARGLEVEFISTGGDDKTYAALANNSATMGIADPIFSMSNDANGVQGEMIGELISTLPLVAVTIHPEIKIDSLQDFSKYRVGSYEKYSTTHTYATSVLPGTQIIPIFHQDILKALINRDIDIVIVLREQANEICQLGGHMLWDFSQDNKRISFSGFTITSLLSDHQRIQAKKVIAAIQEAVGHIKKHPTRALGVMQKLFPNHQALNKTLYEYLGLRNNNILPQEGTTKRSYDMRKKIYPQMFKRFQGDFFQQTYIDKMLSHMKVRKFSRSQPYKEEEIGEIIAKNRIKNLPIRLVGFWGASDKQKVDDHDRRTLDHLKEYATWITKEYVPGVEVVRILADMHGKNNGFKTSHYEKYFKSLLLEFKKRNMKYILLSDIYTKRNVSRSDALDLQFQIVNQQREEISITSKLEDQARKHYQQQDTLEGAKRYYALRMIEKEFLEKEFLGHIFFAYSDSDMQPLYPNIPTLYLWTEKKRYSDPPRFSKY